MNDVGRCRSCDQFVIWAITRSGHKMPVERIGAGAGNVVLKDGVALIVADGEGDCVSHFARCPQARTWRKR